MSTLKVNTIEPSSGTAVAVTGSVAATSFSTAMGFGNLATMSTSTTLPANYNFRLFGPITVGSSIDLIVSVGSEVKII